MWPTVLVFSCWWVNKHYGHVIRYMLYYIYIYIFFLFLTAVKNLAQRHVHRHLGNWPPYKRRFPTWFQTPRIFGWTMLVLGGVARTDPEIPTELGDDRCLEFLQMFMFFFPGPGVCSRMLPREFGYKTCVFFLCFLLGGAIEFPGWILACIFVRETNNTQFYPRVHQKKPYIPKTGGNNLPWWPLPNPTVASPVEFRNGFLGGPLAISCCVSSGSWDSKLVDVAK